LEELGTEYVTGYTKNIKIYVRLMADRILAGSGQDTKSGLVLTRSREFWFHKR
jgi:hypothetical protein